jgi:hypothetical protein
VAVHAFGNGEGSGELVCFLFARHGGFLRLFVDASHFAAALQPLALALW